MKSCWLACVGLSLIGCTDVTDDPNAMTDTSEISSVNAYFHLDTTHGLGAATLSVVNGYKVTCPGGHSATTCEVDALVVPPDCGFECTDGLLGLQGESVVRGSFDGHTFVIAAGFDTFAQGLGGYSIYRITGAPTCSQDPCPTGLVAQKLNTKTKATAIQGVDFSHAVDPNYVLDPTRGDAQIASNAGLLVSGHIVSHKFKVDRTWRLETPKPACDVQEAARAHGLPQDDGPTIQLRTVAEAERYVDPSGESIHWLVRTGESPAVATFTSGINDLWAQEFTVDKATCAVAVTHEH